MRGISIYLGNQSVAEQEAYIKTMREHGFKTIFTSLHIPEADQSLYKEQLQELGQLAMKYEMELMADISSQSLRILGYDWSYAEHLMEWGLTGLRIDYGIDEETIIELSKKMKIALNASTIDADALRRMKKEGLSVQSVEAWHNYYPRPETGLGYEDFIKQNKWLKQEGLQVMAFIPGDEKLRGPLFEKLPTLEEHRHMNPFACFLELENADIDKIIIGDSRISTECLEQFAAYQKNELMLRAQYCQESNAAILEMVSGVHTNRPDAARDCIRSVESRQKAVGTIEPVHCIDRPAGTITIDNEQYLRYQGEIQIVKRSLPADKRVNVVGYIINDDIPLLNWIKGNQRFRIKWIEE